MRSDKNSCLLCKCDSSDLPASASCVTLREQHTVFCCYFPNYNSFISRTKFLILLFAIVQITPLRILMNGRIWLYRKKHFIPLMMTDTIKWILCQLLWCTQIFPINIDGLQSHKHMLGGEQALECCILLFVELPISLCLNVRKAADSFCILNYNWELIQGSKTLFGRHHFTGRKNHYLFLPASCICTVCLGNIIPYSFWILMFNLT